MAEYINREALMRRIKEIHCAECDSYNGVRCRACWVDDTLDYIDSEPAADVVEQEQESKPTNGWISVKDRLPETDGIYIVCDCQLNGNPWIHTAGFIKASSSWCEEHGVYYDDRYGRYSEQDKITHWMPMPEPPEM